jgi:hypothetical protein
MPDGDDPDLLDRRREAVTALVDVVPGRTARLPR